MISNYLKDGHYWFWAICLNQDGRNRDLKKMFSSRCEYDTLITITLTDSNLECFSYVIKKTNTINIRLIS